MKFTTKTLVTMALLSTVAFVIAAVFNLLGIAPIPGTTFPIIDLKDVIIIIGGFLFGVFPAVMMSLVVSLLEWFTGVSKDGFVGFIMNVISTCSLVVVAVLIYRTKKNIVSATIGLIAGILVMVPTMLLWNWLIVPLYMKIPGMSVEDIRKYVETTLLLPVFLPFNLIKGSINAALAIALYKPVTLIFTKAKLN